MKDKNHVLWLFDLHYRSPCSYALYKVTMAVHVMD